MSAALHYTDLEQTRMAHLVRLAEFISVADLDLERDLYRTKWFDYRFMSPEQATQSFADAYVAIYREVWRQEFDRSTAPSKRAIASGGLYHSHREFALMWGARQAADALGTPYELHIRHAMEIKLGLGWKKPPRPNQLCGIKKGEEMVSALQKRWEDRITAMRFTELPIYRSENFFGFQAQLDHQDYVLGRLANHSQRAWAAGSAAVAQRLLPVEKIAQTWGDDFAAQAIDEGRRETPAPVVTVEPRSMLPCCFGRVDEASVICGSCPAMGRCRIVSNVTFQLIEHKHGSSEPLKERVKTLGADRQRRLRQRRAAERAGAKSATIARAPTAARSA